MANGPGGKSAGRVSIRVVPDATRFKADLKKSLDRIEKSTVLQIPLGIETRDADLQIRKFQKKWNGETLNLDVDAKTTLATAHLKEFTRRRSVDVSVNINKASLAKAGTILASLSGARLSGDLVKNFSTWFQNLDRNLPKIAAVALAVGSIGSLALSSVGGLATLAVSLTGILGLAGPLPGILGAAGTGVVILAIALSDAKNQLSSLSPVWANLKSIITDNFWAKAKQPIIDFVRGTLPQLQAGLKPVSTALGSWAASVANGFQTAFGGTVLQGMLDKLQESIDIASTGTGGFASAIATLGAFGASYLPRLAQWFADLANQFDGWLTEVTDDGSLARWAETGITVSKQLFDVMGSLVGIITGVANAASSAGGGGLSSFAGVLSSISDVVNSPAFQSVLSTIFTGAAAGATLLAGALGPIGDTLTVLAPALAHILAVAGSTLGTLLTDIARALDSPGFANGLSSFFDGISAGIAAVGPSLPYVAGALGNLAAFAGQLAAQLGPVLGAALQALAPILIAVLAALTPLLPQLGGALVTAIQTLAPSMLDLVNAIAPLLPQLVTIAVEALPPLTNAFVILTPLIVDLLNIILAIITPIVQFGLGINAMQAALSGAGDISKTLSDILNGKFGPALQGIFSVVMPLADALRNGLAGAAGFVGDAFQNVSGVVRGAINGVISLVNGAIRALNRLSVSIPAWVPGIGGQTFGISLPTIPSLAQGAVINPTAGGTVIRAGEAGHPESVVDYGKQNKALDLMNRLAVDALESGPGAAGVTANIYTQENDGRVIGRQAAREILRALAG